MRCLCLLIALFAAITTVTYGQRRVLSENFDHSLDTTRWIVEAEPSPNASVAVSNGKLVLDTPGGVTVWFRRPLTGNIRITYTRVVRVDGKINDRLSDMNQFWMASDPSNPTLFTRTGVFEQYDSLRLYYAGIGGNTNTTSRFRKYTGHGERHLLAEYTDADHLLKPNHVYHIVIEVHEGVVRLFVDGVCYFAYTDPEPLRHGYFGFRATASRQEIDDVRIYEQ